MKSFFKIYLFLYFSFHFCSLYAQDDFAPASWETKAGQTKQGFVQDKVKNGKYLMVKYIDSDKPIQKSADDISKVIQNGFPVIYSYDMRSGGTTHSIFLELLSKGQSAHLYRGKDDVLGKLYAIYKNDQFTILYANTDLKESYRFLYGDCENFILKEKYTFTEKGIMNAFASYNDCLGYDISANVITRKQWKPVFYIGPKLGLNYGKFNLVDDSYLARGSYSDFLNYRIGAIGKMGISERFSTQLEISYYNKNTTSDSVNTWPAIYPEVYSTVTFDFDVLDIQFLVNYSIISKPKFKTDIGIGFDYGHLLNAEYQQEEFDPIGEGIGPIVVHFDDAREIGIIANLGFIYILNNNNQFSLTARYIGIDMDAYMFISVGDLIVRNGTYQVNSSMVELSLSYLFRF
jgi:hypothetical protein